MKIREVKAEQLNSMLEKKSTVVLDIREDYEYEEDHLESLHIPMAEVRNRLDELNQHEKIVVCCKSGKRAQAVAYMLNNELDSADVSYLKGGLTAYREIYAQD